MALKNKWVSYLDRGYLQIKQSILNRLRTIMPEYSDFSESNIFVIISSIVAGLVEQIHYYIDQLLRESFITTARRYTSVVRHSRLFDYRIKAANSASTVLTLVFKKAGEQYFLGSGETETVPIGTIFTSSGLNFVSTKTVTVGQYSGSINIPVSQYSNSELNFIINTSTTNQSYELGLNYVHNSISLLVDGIPWQQVTTFGKSLDSDRHFIIDIGIDGKAYIVFGDNIRGVIPSLNSNVSAFFRVTAGTLGNLPAGSISTKPNIVWNHLDDYSLFQYNNATGGTGYENIQTIKVNVPLSLRTLERAVTKRDYEDIAVLHPGVNKSYVIYECGKYVDVYISPMGSGIAQQPLLDDVKDWFEDSRMATTLINTKSAGESQIVIDIEVVGKFRAKSALIGTQVRSALTDSYGYSNSNINKHIRVSDLYALVDNQTLVEYLTINKLYLIPYPFPLSHNTPLNINFEMVLNDTIKNYLLVCISGTTFQIQNNGIIEAEINISEEYNNGVFKLTILPGGYQVGNFWSIRVYPINTDIVVNDNSIPIIKEENILLTIKETISI